MDIYEKLKILSAAAKFDVACTSSGVNRKSGKDGIGSAVSYGICHTFSGDGHCISLLKILMSNDCVYDCKYCLNRRSNDIPRATFTPQEIAELTINFYRRNYIEGLFLSSGVYINPNETVERLLATLKLLREKYRFYGYIHIKAIPGASTDAIRALGYYADRMSVNIELPTESGLKLLAPQKSKESILKPMGMISSAIKDNKNEVAVYKNAPHFVPAGQSTQMIVGATNDSDLQILRLTEGLYKKYSLKRVFFSAYVPVVENNLLPTLDTKPPLLREHRLYQADWLLRYYNFKADELLDEDNRNLNEFLDPKSNWAINNLSFFPIELRTAEYNEILRVPGIGVTSAKRIIAARKNGLSFEGIARMGVVLKRAKYFITVNGKMADGVIMTKFNILNDLIGANKPKTKAAQLDFFEQIETLSEKIDGIR